MKAGPHAAGSTAILAAMPHLRDLPRQLEELSRQGLLRQPDEHLERAAYQQRFGARFLDFTSNDYLGLTAAPIPQETLSSAPGAGASRLLFGSRPEHLALEQELAAWTGFESALLFASGYAANVGALSCLAGPSDLVISDALNHASLIDGCRLSRAEVRILPHRDLEALERALEDGFVASARWVVVESYYSMDGDSPDLPAIRALCDRHDAHLYVDEAHALGVFGAAGAGRCAEQGVRPDVLLGGLGKACGGQGGFVASSVAVRQWLWNRARSFVFSTAPSPLLAALLKEQVHRVREADDLRELLHEHTREFRRLLEARGVPLLASGHGPILGIPVGLPQRALALATVLKQQGILVQPIRPPTVPEGASRLRLTVTARHRAEDLERAAAALGEAFGSKA